MGRCDARGRRTRRVRAALARGAGFRARRGGAGAGRRRVRGAGVPRRAAARRRHARGRAGGGFRRVRPVGSRRRAVDGPAGRGRAAGGVRRPGDAAHRGGTAALRHRPHGGDHSHRGVRIRRADGARHFVQQGLLHGAGGDRPHRPPRPREPPPARPSAGGCARAGTAHAPRPSGDGQGDRLGHERRVLATAGRDDRAGIRPARGAAGGQVRVGAVEGAAAGVVDLPFRAS